MGQFLAVNGDYNIKTLAGAKITLDTGPTGEVKVTGNLVVEGTTLIVDVENLEVSDNIIKLNKDETGAGVTLRYSGIEVERGSVNNSGFIFDENDDTWNLVEGQPGGYTYVNSKLRVKELLTNPDTDDGDLLVIGSGIGVIKVTGTLDYENQVTDDDDIPNRKFVLDAIQNQPARQIISDPKTAPSFSQTPTRVIVSDVDAGDEDFLGNLVTESEVAVIIDDNPTAAFYEDRVRIQDVVVSNNEISPFDSGDNLVLTTSGSRTVTTNVGLSIDTGVGSPPSLQTGKVLIYSRPAAVGDTDLWFRNDNYGTSEGELISKNKALVFSMLF
jgi:hypothetical protein